MKKTTLIKLLCLAFACLLIVPMVIACDKDGDEEPVLVYVDFDTRGGEIVDGDEEIELESGDKLRRSMLPTVEKEGYIFDYWSYDKGGEDEWSSKDTFEEDTTLYAQWERDDAGNNENPGGSTESTDGGSDVPDKEMVTITFKTGVGYFEDNKYTVQVEKNGYFQGALPTPVCDNAAMKFEGWFWDETWTKQISRSDVYSTDVEIFACWIQMTPCKDGSYEHEWSAWDTGALPTCTTAGTKVQFCTSCNAENTMPGAPATGHKWPEWQEGFLQRERTCRTPGCGAFQSQKFENITLSTLGNNPSGQVKLQGNAWGSGRVSCVVDGVWDQSNEASFDPMGDTPIKVTITLVNPAAMDRIYVKGYGADSSFKVMVQYEGESDYTLAGMGSFLTSAANADKENRVIPYVEVDNTKNIVSVRIDMDTPSSSAEYWEEVGFIVIPPIVEE